jgi:hypothetical protein
MKYFLVLSVLAVAALGAPTPQPDRPICLSETLSLLPVPDGAWLDSLYGPPDTVYGDTVIRFGAMLHSVEPYPQANVKITLRDNEGDTLDYIRIYEIAAGDSALVDWEFSTAGESGYYEVRDLFLDTQGEPPWDTWLVTWRFCVVPTGGVVEEPELQTAGRSPRPTFIRSLDPGSVAFDAMGRRVLNPRPGICFVRPTPAAPPRKVLLVE